MQVVQQDMVMFSAGSAGAAAVAMQQTYGMKSSLDSLHGNLWHGTFMCLGPQRLCVCVDLTLTHPMQKQRIRCVLCGRTEPCCWVGALLRAAVAAAPPRTGTLCIGTVAVTAGGGRPFS